MDIKQLEYFVEVCRYMSFTKAAASQYISQQGMSKSIRRMEEELGVELFQRTSSALQLTDYAECFLPYAKEIVRNWHFSINDLNVLRNTQNGFLHVGISHGFVNILPTDLLTEFSRSNPKFTMRMNEYSDYELDRALISGLVDVAFCIMPVDETKITIHHVHKENTFYMLSEKHPLAQQESLDLGQLKDELFMGFGADNKGHVVFYERCRKAGFEPKFAIMSQDMNMIKELCRNNMGIGFYVGDRNKRIEGIKIIPDTCWEWGYEIGICTSKGRKPSKSAEIFIENMKKWG